METVIANPLAVLEDDDGNWEEDEGDWDDEPEVMPEEVLEDTNRWLHLEFGEGA
jgi:hypothetical protein